MTKVRAPVLLDSNFNDVRRLEPSSLSLSLVSTPPSTADMTIPFDASDPVPIRAWVRLYDLHGNAEVYRVSASDTLYDTQEQRLTLEHGITSLRDTIVPSPPDPETDSEIHYTSGNTVRPFTASEMLAFILVSQVDNNCWQAGTCAATDDIFLDRNGDSLLELLLDMMEQLPDYDLAFNFSTTPWTVSIVAKAQTITAEGRLSRNLGTVRVTYDDSELCTRVWYNAKRNGAYVGDYLDADTKAIYGTVEGSIYLDTDTKLADAEALAAQYLKKHKEPAISVELDAVDLSLATGETIDAFTLGKKFRLTIPAYGLVVDQWITGLTYQDVYGDPDHVTLTLGNRVADISQRSAKTTRKAKSAARSASGAGGGGARSGAKKTAEATTRIEKTEDHISLIATDAQLAEAESTHQTIFTIQAGQISSKVSQTDYNGSTIISYINQTATTIKIHAQHIDLDGYVTASQLAAAFADMGSIAATNAVIDRLTVNNTMQMGQKQVSWQSKEIVTDVPNSSVTVWEYTFDSEGKATGKYTASKSVSINPDTETIYYLGRASS